MATTFGEFGEEIYVATAEEMVAQQNAEFEAMGGANEESGSVNELSNAEGTTDVNTPSAGTTVAGKANTTGSLQLRNKPNRRWQNPLANFSSYTYNLSLYMITPDAYDAFVLSGRKNINALSDAAMGGGGAYLIAQSGGINNTTSNRAPGFDLDYYIDNLKIQSAINGKDTGTGTNTYEMTFDIHEPYGFKFITNLKVATDALQAYAQGKGKKSSQNASRQFFILGISFKGYDQKGELITSEGQLNTGLGQPSDPAGNSDGIYVRYFDIFLTEIHFKIDGKAVTYNITAAPMAQTAAMGVKRGMIDAGATIVGTTIREALIGSSGLITKLNSDQKKLLDTNKILETNNYTVRFVGPGVERLEAASIVSKADTDKRKMPMPKVKSVGDVTPGVEVKAKPKTDERQVTFNQSTPVAQAISQLISQSTFLEDALVKVFVADEEVDPDDPESETQKNVSQNTLLWYNLSTQVANARWDEKVGDFAYDITYVIQLYYAPIIVAPYVKNLPKYYGPHKRYNYWYTGLNSEIISYTQTMNNTYFNVALAPDGSGLSQGGGADIPTIPGKRQPTARLGKQGDGAEAQNAIVTSLYDPGAYANAKVTIMGDPDFLMPLTPDSLQTVYNQFYQADGYTINPNGGQVFIEICFYEASDYDNTKGIMKINDRILFWKYPPEIQKDIDSRGGGISYMVINVLSTFKGGKFTQELDLVINTFEDATNNQNNSNRGVNTKTNTAPATQTTGVMEERPFEAQSSGDITDPMGTGDGASIMNAVEN